MSEWSNAKICDVINLILGAGLVVSPWFFAFAAGVQTQNAIVGGAAIVVLSIAALVAWVDWEEWMNLFVGLWLIISAWILDFTGTTAMTVHLVVGVLVAALAAIELYMMYRHPPHMTAAQ